MKTLITIGFIASVTSFGGLCAAQSFNKNFAESERALASKCISVYQATPKNGDQIVTTCSNNLNKMKALKTSTSGLNDTDTRLFYLYSAMATSVLTIGNLVQNGGRASSTACINARQAIALGEKVGFQQGSKYESSVLQMITGFKTQLIPHCQGQQ